MTDRELLEAAAKAAGIGNTIPVYGVPPFMGLAYSGCDLWNPLTDDGDALRLAATMGHKRKAGVTLAVAGGMSSVFTEIGLYAEPCGDDPAKALRRAIVRAAAQLPPP